MLQISWLDAPTLIDSSIRYEPDKLEASISNDLENRTKSVLYYLRNDGSVAEDDSTIAYEAGLYLSSYVKENTVNNNLHEVLIWPSVEDTGHPCGVFAIFGFDSLNRSYIDRFLGTGDALTREEEVLFQFNWTNGNGPVNPIKLGIVNRYVNGAYQLSDNLGPTDDLTESTTGENTGLLKILLVIRVPSTAKVQRTFINLNLWYMESV